MHEEQNRMTPLAEPARVEVFGFDVAEISQIRRIRAIAELGHEVHSFTMRRRNMKTEFVPDWPNTHLYETQNEALGRRVRVIAASMLRMFAHRPRLRASDVIIARNLDMLAIAVFARWIARSRAGLVYECLDIHSSLTGTGSKSRVMRRAERFLLRAVDMLVVSSPGFMRHYFDPVQGYAGRHALWENKLAVGGVLPPRPAPQTRTPREGPLRVGWVGTIRCAPSLAILSEFAQAHRDTAEIHIHGIVHHHAVPEFDAVLERHPNMIFHGPYDYPADLAQVYGGLDVVWAQDLWQSGGNSDWLLPNRIYEASWAGCPSIAVADTETGRRVDADALGWTLPAPRAAALAALLTDLSREEIAARGRDLLSRPDTDFVQSSGELTGVIEDMAALARARRGATETPKAIKS